VDATRLTQLALGYWPARALSAAAELGVLDLLAEAPCSADEVASRLGLRSAAVPDLLDALVALGVLVRDERGYRSLLGDPSLLRAEAAGYRAWADLPAALREGRPVFADGPDAEVLRALGEVAVPAHPAIAALVEPWERVTDVGGGSGLLARALAERGAVVTTFDRHRPSVEGVEVVVGDFFADDLPPSDTAVLCLVLLDWSTEDKRRLLERVAASTRRILVVDRMGEPERPTATFELLRQLHLLVTVGDAFHYEPAALAGWLAEVGFAAGEPVELPGGLTLVEGRAG
jgi:biotin operon repressor